MSREASTPSTLVKRKTSIKSIGIKDETAIPRQPAPTSVLNDYLELARFWKPAGAVAFHIPLTLGIMMAILIEMPRLNLSQSIVFSLKTLVASVLQRSAACVWNDAADYKFDASVERTRNRPIPRGAISPSGARWYALGLTAWWTAVVFLTRPTSIWTLVPNLLFNIAYPYTKRLTFYPQVFLGFMFSCNILTGYAMTSQLDTIPELFRGSAIVSTMVSLVLSNAAFTVFYDTIYGYQDIADDKKAGVKSMSLLLGSNGKVVLFLFAMIQVVTLVIAGVGLRAGSLYFLITCGGSALLNLVALQSCDLLKPADCGLWFKRLLYGGQLIQAHGMLVEYLVRT